MLRRWILFLVCLGCSLPFSGAVTSARFELRVDEKASRILLTGLAPRVSLEVGEEITCRVKAERVGFRGDGMLLAEIGLPPGADVD